MSFGERLQELRKKKNLTQLALADIINVNVQTLARYEKNQRDPSIKTLFFLSRYFNVSIDYLLGKTDIENINEYRFNKLSAEVDKNLNSIDEHLNYYIDNKLTYVPKNELEIALKGLIVDYLSHLNFEEPYSVDMLFIITQIFKLIETYILTTSAEITNKKLGNNNYILVQDLFDITKGFSNLEKDLKQILEKLIYIILNDNLDLTFDEELILKYHD